MESAQTYGANMIREEQRARSVVVTHGRAPLGQYIFGPQKQMFPGPLELTLSFHNIHFFKGYSVVYQMFDQIIAESFL